MFETVPTNQHYVWRHYLEAWAVDGKVACHRQGERTTFVTNPKNIASRRFFYAAEQLTSEELTYLRAVAEGAPTEELKELDREVVETFALPTAARRIMDAAEPDEALRQDLDGNLVNAERGLGELWHGQLEERAKRFLYSLRDGDASFWPEDEEILDFCFFLAAQYLRTPRMAKKVCGAVLPFGLDLQRVWPVESHLWANRIGHAIHRDRAITRATMLVNRTRTPFVTGDQPVVNMRSVEERDPQFYYPVSPTAALMLTRGGDNGEAARREVSALEAETLNHRIFTWSEDQLYGTDGAYLEALASLPRGSLT